jgi:hypothetical protein
MKDTKLRDLLEYHSGTVIFITSNTTLVDYASRPALSTEKKKLVYAGPYFVSRIRIPQTEHA